MASPTAERPSVPQTTVRRLSTYLRTLGLEAASGTQSISSARLSEVTGFTAAQIRRDLANFGHFGRRGVGYSVEGLRLELRAILGVDIEWSVALIGVGNLGKALLAYKGFNQMGFTIAAAFDNDQRKVGSTLSGLTVEPISKLAERVRELGIQLAIMTTPAEAAQEVLDSLVASGIRAVLNFAPRRLRAPEGVQISNVDLTIEVEYLSHSLSQRRLS
ncbi:MAG: redox-sensing transcriptional repressor Rex [Chloroflexi bacterium]|nr:redox-sensing transcriptional repressor Rex [Chloroflexota bacterium]